MSTKKKLWTIVAVVVVVAVIAVIVNNGSSKSPNSGANAKVITFAEAPGAPPNYIFPYMSGQFFSVSNINQFQELMFRPLYWFGLGSSVAVVPSLSTGDMPVFSKGDKTVTITMKGWKFADGQTVNAQSVMFFLNMYKANPSSFAGYNPGYGIPDQVKNATGSGDTVVINFTKSVNPNWMLYNYLSEITPFPDAWDHTSATATSTCATGIYGAASTNSACKAVQAYLDAQSAIVSSFPDSMWQSGVDGPWKLTAIDDLGNATFAANTKYSGPQKAQVPTVKLLAFTTSSAEQNQLPAGQIDVGYIDPTVLTQPAVSPEKAGPNWTQIASTYNLLSGPMWSFNYAPFNFSTNNPKSAAMNQLYIRQALQESVDQIGIIHVVDKGYGVPSTSPLPVDTPASISGSVANPYPFNLMDAKKLLASHGWTMQRGVRTCTDPGNGPSQCGAGITRGYTLNFTILYMSGQTSLTDTFNAEISNWNTIGIKFTSSTATFNQVIADCTSSKQKYEICSWGAGWVYAPDYYPSGETLFTTTGGFNPGGYSNPTMNTMVNATTFGKADLTAYALYAAQQLPVLYQPNPVVLNEVIKTLTSSIGFTPNPLGNFMPEYMKF
jgi:peptide/nickel transport system substrate-binding protein